MAAIDSYTVDTTINDADTIIGSDSANSDVTRNFRMDDISDYVRGNIILSDTGITATLAEVNVLDGFTGNTTELNVVDGLTASTTELNLMDGATITTTELNRLDGVTGNIQTQLNAVPGDNITTGTINDARLSSNVVLKDEDATLTGTITFDHASGETPPYFADGLRVGADSTSNELDDYEEGTWTPGVLFETVTNSSGTYTKVGRMVMLHGRFDFPTSTHTDLAIFDTTAFPFDKFIDNQASAGNWHNNSTGNVAEHGNLVSIGSLVYSGESDGGYYSREDLSDTTIIITTIYETNE